MNRPQLKELLAKKGVPGRVWGRRGPEQRGDIERVLGSSLSPELAEAVESVGNATIGPFNLIVAGADDGGLGALLRSSKYSQEDLGGVVIMDHAGEVYVYTTCDGSVRAYDEACISRSNETLSFETFGEFVEWLTDEAQSMKPHMTCCRILNRLVAGKWRAIL